MVEYLENEMTDFNLPTAEIDENFHYKISPHRQIDDFCRMRLYALQSDRPICVLTELKHSGMSVTNAVEKIIPQVQQAYNLKPNTLYIEHYDNDSFYSDNEPATFDALDLDKDKPTWRRLDREELMRLFAFS